MNLLRYLEKNKKLMVKVFAGVLLFVIAFAFYLAKEISVKADAGISVTQDVNVEKIQVTTPKAIDEAEKYIIVDVAGAVTKPSVVKLPDGSRVFEAIEKAGGLKNDADLRSTNQAEVLTDGQKIYIPTSQELDDIQTGNTPSEFVFQADSERQGKININTADSEALQQLTGVGPATAERIISYRNENGKFKAIEDIKNVKGIGDKTFEKFKDKITV